MSNEPKKSWIIWILLPLYAMSIGSLLTMTTYHFRNGAPFSDLANRIFFIPGLGNVNGAILVGSLLSAGLLMIICGLFALTRY
jgi:hypothetical protein